MSAQPLKPSLTCTCPIRMRQYKVLGLAPETLALADRPIRPCRRTKSLIQVAARRQPSDAMQRCGVYPPPAGASNVPGLEIAGTVAAVGDNVRILSVGEPVCRLDRGGYAEFVRLARLPTVPYGFDFIQAAALPETFFTVWSNVFDRAHLSRRKRCWFMRSTVSARPRYIWQSFWRSVFVTSGSDDRKCEFCLTRRRCCDQLSERGFCQAVKQLTEK